MPNNVNKTYAERCLIVVLMKKSGEVISRYFLLGMTVAEPIRP